MRKEQSEIFIKYFKNLLIYSNVLYARGEFCRYVCFSVIFIFYFLVFVMLVGTPKCEHSCEKTVLLIRIIAAIVVKSCAASSNHSSLLLYFSLLSSNTHSQGSLEFFIFFPHIVCTSYLDCAC